MIPAHFLGDCRHVCSVNWYKHWILPLSLVLCLNWLTNLSEH